MFGSDEGASSVEYALIAVAIAAVIVLAVVGVGAATNSLFAETCTSLSTEIVVAGAAC